MSDNDIQDVDLGPGRIAASAVVNAPADELFALLANPHRHHEVDGSGMVQPQVIGPRELEPGDRFQVAMKIAGRIPYRITSTVVDLVPGRVVAWQHPGKHIWRWEFQPLDGGSTRVTEIFDYRPSRGGKILEKLGRVDANRHAIESSLRRLQERFA